MASSKSDDIWIILLILALLFGISFMWKDSPAEGWIDIMNNTMNGDYNHQNSDTYWQVEYFNNVNLQGVPVYTENVSTLTRVFNGQSPNTYTPSTYWSARWTRNVYFDNNVYSFFINSDDGVRFYIDNQLLLDDWQNHSAWQDFRVFKRLSGLHSLKMEYFQGYGNSSIYFNYEAMRQIVIPQTATNSLINGNFNTGLNNWGWFTNASFPSYNVWQSDAGGGHMHLIGNTNFPSIETWSGKNIPTAHPGDTIIVTGRIRTGPRTNITSPRCNGARYGVDLRPIINGTRVQLQCGEFQAGAVKSDDWVNLAFEITIPEIGPQGWGIWQEGSDGWNLKWSVDDETVITGPAGGGVSHRPGSVNYFGAQMPQDIDVVIWAAICGQNTVEWADFDDLKVYLVQ